MENYSSIIESDSSKQVADGGTDSSKEAFRLRLRALSRIISAFLMGQGALQALNMMTGIFLLRTLSVESYAQFSLALGFQTTAMSLTSLGLTDSVIPLVGASAHDYKKVGSYICSARYLRSKLFLTVAPCCAIAFHLVWRDRGWPIQSQLLLLVSILLSLYFSVSVSCYSAPLLLHRRLFDFYLGQTAAAAVRLGAYITLSATALLGPGTASLISGGSVLINGAIALRKSSLLMEMPKRADKATNKEVLKYVLPAAPACLFAAFQPQLSLFLVGVFGQTLQIAEVAALTKISQIFLIINTFNAVVIEPYVAKIRADQLASTYVRLIGSAIAFTALLSIVSLLFPSAITAITGSKYQQLSRVVPLTVLSSCVNAVANLIWIMNRSRRWQFWRGSALEIGLLVCCQTIFIVTLGVRTTRDAAMFSLATSITILAVHTYIMIYGFQKSATRKNRQEFEANATRDPNPQ